MKIFLKLVANFYIRTKFILSHNYQLVLNEYVDTWHFIKPVHLVQVLTQDYSELAYQNRTQ